MVLLQGPTGWRFLISEVPLYGVDLPPPSPQGYLAHKQHSPPRDPSVGLFIGPHGDPRGGSISYERGTPEGG